MIDDAAYTTARRVLEEELRGARDGGSLFRYVHLAVDAGLYWVIAMDPSHGRPADARLDPLGWQPDEEKINLLIAKAWAGNAAADLLLREFGRHAATRKCLEIVPQSVALFLLERIDRPIPKDPAPLPKFVDRDLAIGHTVFTVGALHGIRRTRGRDKHGDKTAAPSACAVVAAVLPDFEIDVDEGTVENISERFGRLRNPSDWDAAYCLRLLP